MTSTYMFEYIIELLNNEQEEEEEGGGRGGGKIMELHVRELTYLLTSSGVTLQ